jgi:DnaK suppressor protein
MDDSHKENISRVINSEIEKIDEEIPKLRKLAEPVAPDSALGRLTRMEAIQQQKIHEATLRSMKQRLILLNNSLKRIETDSFGVCSSCGEEIPIARILAIPHITTCVDCAS